MQCSRVLPVTKRVLLRRVGLIRRLHDEANMKQTWSKHQANIFKILVHDVCYTFALWVLHRVNGVLVSQNASTPLTAPNLSHFISLVPTVFLLSKLWSFFTLSRAIPWRQQSTIEIWMGNFPRKYRGWGDKISDSPRDGALIADNHEVAVGRVTSQPARNM